MTIPFDMVLVMISREILYTDKRGEGARMRGNQTNTTARKRET